MFSLHRRICDFFGMRLPEYLAEGDDSAGAVRNLAPAIASCRTIFSSCSIPRDCCCF
jgi:hypothetical protein